MNGRFTRWVCLGLASAVCFGCGGSDGGVNEDPDTLNPVRGSIISVNGKEIPNGSIIAYHPKAGPVAGQQIVGQYDDGENFYTLTTINGTEKLAGAPEGDYVVTIQPPKNKTGAVPTKYNSPSTSDITIQVKAGTNILPDLALTP